MLVFKCKIKILLIIQLTYILYHFKANCVYFKNSWIIKSKYTSLDRMTIILHSTFERNISLAFQARLIFLSNVSCNNIKAILSIRYVLTLYQTGKNEWSWNEEYRLCLPLSMTNYYAYLHVWYCKKYHTVYVAR